MWVKVATGVWLWRVSRVGCAQHYMPCVWRLVGAGEKVCADDWVLGWEDQGDEQRGCAQHHNLRRDNTSTSPLGAVGDY